MHFPASPVSPLPSALPPGCAIDLLTRYGSPLYVYDGDRLRHTIHHITSAFSYPQTHFHFASVTNGNLALLQLFHSQGWGLHANTPGDIYLGLQAGFSPHQIVYSGSNLSRSDMAQILTWGIRSLNLDSVAQVEMFVAAINRQSPPSLPPFRLGLRLNHPPLTGDSRIGVRPEEFAIAHEIAQQAGLAIAGLHFYRGTGTNATKAFIRAIDEVIAIAQTLPDWTYLDFGGGFGYPYHHAGVAFAWPEFGQHLSDRLRQLNRPLDLVIEPGRAAIAGCGVLLCQVVSVKWQDGRQIVGIDTTVANLSVPSVHGGYREIVAIGARQTAADSQETVSTDVCGNTTYSRDYLGRNCQLPPLQLGDILAILDVGAYGYAMSSHFLHRPRPAEVLLENGHDRLIRQREDYSVLLTNQLNFNPLHLGD